MKCGNAFTKGHLNVCPAKEIICNYKGHLGRLCKSKGRRPVVNNLEEIVNNPNCSYSLEDLQVKTKEDFCGVIKHGQKREQMTLTIIQC